GWGATLRAPEPGHGEGRVAQLMLGAEPNQLGAMFGVDVGLQLALAGAAPDLQGLLERPLFRRLVEPRQLLHGQGPAPSPDRPRYRTQAGQHILRGPAGHLGPSTGLLERAQVLLPGGRPRSAPGPRAEEPAPGPQPCVRY